MAPLSIVQVALSISFVLGQLIKLPFISFQPSMFDLVLPIYFAIVFTSRKHRKNISLSVFVPFLIFSFVHLCFSLLHYNIPPLVPALFFLRLSMLLTLFSSSLPRFSPYLLVCLISSFVIFGLVQYLIWPNITTFSSLNWDPHLNRIVGTMLDPTFTALIFLFFLIDIFNNRFSLPSNLNKIILVITYLALALTYSRSTMLALIVSSLYLALRIRKIRVFLITAILVITTFILLPQKEGEGANLYRTSTILAKIENYQQAANLYLHHPLGIGFNTISYFKNDTTVSHAKNGFDSSLANILITTGPIGLILFILAGYNLFKIISLSDQTKIVALLIHSLFANSLLYPMVLFYLVITFKYRK